MEGNKLWFNVTRLENGWLVKYPVFSATGSEPLRYEETYFEELGGVWDFMYFHVDNNGLDAVAYGLTRENSAKA